MAATDATTFTTSSHSERVLAIAAMFDLDLELATGEARSSASQSGPAHAKNVSDDTGDLTAARIPLPRGGIVFITGPSGGGKTTLLRAIERRLCSAAENVNATGGGSLSDGRLDFVFSLKLNMNPEGLGAGGATGRSANGSAGDIVPRAGAVIDCFDDVSFPQALAILSRAGLAEARLLVRSPDLLSEGERFRLQLALLFAKAEGASARAMGSTLLGREVTDPRAILLVDEFCSCLDRAAARTIARSVRRWIAGTPHTLIVASAHDDLLEPLEPDLFVIVSLDGSIEAHRRDEIEPGLHCPRGPCRAELDGDLVIEEGAIADYDELAKHHYRAGRPATIERVFRIVRRGPTIAGRYFRRRDEREVIGVLVRSFPTLSCALRDHALGGRYRGLSQRERARIISAEVRTISRVVIDPRYRGAGLASRLVRHALERAATPCTEALAAMGGAHPFFERAGMTRFDGPPRAEDARLLDALVHAGLAPRGALDLVLTDALAKRIETLEGETRAWIEREIERWRSANEGLRRSRRTKAHDKMTLEPDLRSTLRLARRSIASRPVYYLATHQTPNGN